MALTPREQHQWFLITQDINAQGGLPDPELEVKAAILWRYVGSAFYFAVGVLCLAMGIFAFSPIVALLGAATAVVGVLQFRSTYGADLLRCAPARPLE